MLISGPKKHFGGIAQLVERLVRNEKARGSNPLTSSFSRSAKKTVTDEAWPATHPLVEDEPHRKAVRAPQLAPQRESVLQSRSR